MGTRISRGFAVFVLSAAFAALDVSAQTGSEAKPSHGAAVVSVDLLRHPIAPKVRHLLRDALEKMDSGDHEAAIQQLLGTLAKYPDSAAYVHSLLGVEYVKTDQFEAAISSFEQAALLLPHEAMTHYNFGLALVCAGDYDRAAQEVQRALELDPRNAKMQAALNALMARQEPVRYR